MVPSLFYSHFAADPYFNMAFDEWLLARAEETPGFFAVRLYTWQPGTITFGLNQKRDRAYRAEALGNTPVIRRVTGGRAIFHDPSELTYTVALNLSQISVPVLAGTLSDTSARIAVALQAFLERTGLHTDYARQSSPENARPDFFHTAPCFASHARYELMAGSRKVVASAQRRLDHSMLQHGSLKLSGVAGHRALGSGEAGVTLQPILADQFNDLAASGRAALAHAFGVSFSEPILTPEETEDIRIRCDAVRKNSFDKRNAIKQSAAAVSL